MIKENFIPYENYNEFLIDQKNHGNYISSIDSEEFDEDINVFVNSNNEVHVDFKDFYAEKSTISFKDLLNEYKWKDGFPCGKLNASAYEYALLNNYSVCIISHNKSGVKEIAQIHADENVKDWIWVGCPIVFGNVKAISVGYSMNIEDISLSPISEELFNTWKAEFEHYQKTFKDIDGRKDKEDYQYWKQFMKVKKPWFKK